TGERGALRIAAEQLRNSEIEQLDRAVAGYEDVGRLDVPMHDQMAVGVRHGRQHREKQLDARFDIQLMPPAVGVDRLAFDVFDHQVGQTAIEHAGIDQPRDVGMIELSEQIALDPEALLTGGALPGGVHELDRDRAPESAIGAMGAPDASHAAPADL